MKAMGCGLSMRDVLTLHQAGWIICSKADIMHYIDTCAYASTHCLLPPTCCTSSLCLYPQVRFGVLNAGNFGVPMPAHCLPLLTVVCLCLTFFSPQVRFGVHNAGNFGVPMLAHCLPLLTVACLCRTLSFPAGALWRAQRGQLWRAAVAQAHLHLGSSA
jgi:hypothetical protein